MPEKKKGRGAWRDGMREKRIRAHEDMEPHHRLTRSLSWPHLIALGVGAIVGTGILTLTGVGAAKAGPAVILSFAIAGLICAAAALAYAEMATMIPASGSAYTYTYVVLGELLAWIVGWSLILEYSLVVSAVAVGWSGYAAPLLHAWAGFPIALSQGPELGGIINLPAIFIIAVVAGLLIYGTKESATLNAVLVCVKVLALIVFVAVTLPYFDAAHFDPFMPFGFPKSGVDRTGRRPRSASWPRRRSSSSPFTASTRSRPRLRRPRIRAAISRSASSDRWSPASSSTWRSPAPRSARSLMAASPTARSRWP